MLLPSVAKRPPPGSVSRRTTVRVAIDEFQHLRAGHLPHLVSRQSVDYRPTLRDLVRRQVRPGNARAPLEGRLWPRRAVRAPRQPSPPAAGRGSRPPRRRSPRVLRPAPAPLPRGRCWRRRGLSPGSCGPEPSGDPTLRARRGRRCGAARRPARLRQACSSTRERAGTAPPTARSSGDKTISPASTCTSTWSSARPLVPSGRSPGRSSMHTNAGDSVRPYVRLTGTAKRASKSRLSRSGQSPPPTHTSRRLARSVGWTSDPVRPSCAAVPGVRSRR